VRRHPESSHSYQSDDIARSHRLWVPGTVTGRCERRVKRLERPVLVTVPGKPGDGLAAGTLSSILKQAKLKT